MPGITNGKYIRYNSKRFFVMDTAITDGVTTVPAEAVQGSIGVTTHATGKSYWYVSDGTHWIANGGAVSSTAFADVTGLPADNAALVTALALKQDKTTTVNAQTGTSYLLLASDVGKIITLSNVAAITVTVPAGLGAGFHCTLVQLGAGQVSFTATGTTIHNRQSQTKINAQYGEVTLKAYAANTFVLSGDTGV